ncbi:hypothetical protein G6F21_014684 [Rhizopus arrhizus]|nr:hypothetical protein G6F21_014684 [Rhizopus arrhizus]
MRGGGQAVGAAVGMQVAGDVVQRAAVFTGGAQGDLRAFDIAGASTWSYLCRRKSRWRVMSWTVAAST